MDFELRKKTAQLMAIAPGVPVADLYHLLVNKKCLFDAANQEAMRMSENPFTPKPAKASIQARAATVPPTDSVHQEDDSAGPWIKIDFDNPAFRYDHVDAPATPPPDSRRQKQRKRPKENTRKTTTEPLKGVRGDRKSTSCRQSDINRGVRETSYDRDFVVPDDDDGALDNSDDSYSDSDESATSDTDMMDDDADLSIDMEPPYAYNSDILSSPSSSSSSSVSVR